MRWKSPNLDARVLSRMAIPNAQFPVGIAPVTVDSLSFIAVF